MNKVLLEDFINISKSNINFNELKNKSILITGATGFIGSLCVKSLLYCDEIYKLNLKIIAQVRDVKKVNEIFCEYLSDYRLVFVYCDFLKDKLEVSEKVDYIIHTASVTSSKYMTENPVETINTSIIGTSKSLEFAKNNSVTSMVYVSSMEMYGYMDKPDMTIESDLGYINLLSSRSSYPESKRMCECLCYAYSSEYNINVKIARLAQTFGAGVLKTENRVFAQFAKSALENSDIVLHTEGKSEGNYVYISDAITALLFILLKGEKGETYNICNEESHTTIKGMAELVADKICNNKIKVIYDLPENDNFGYAPDTKLFLSSEKLRKLGWKPTVNLIDSYRRMIEYMRGNE